MKLRYSSCLLVKMSRLLFEPRFLSCTTLFNPASGFTFTSEFAIINPKWPLYFNIFHVFFFLELNFSITLVKPMPSLIFCGLNSMFWLQKRSRFSPGCRPETRWTNSAGDQREQAWVTLMTAAVFKPLQKDGLNHWNWSLHVIKDRFNYWIWSFHGFLHW